MDIRPAAISDRPAIERLYTAAFPAEERDLVANVAMDLLVGPSVPDTLTFVADDDDDVIGHIAFSPATCDTDPTLRASILSPLVVEPRSQGKGIGRALIEVGFESLRSIGVDAVFVYGDPDYYGRHGFEVEPAAGLLPLFELEYPHGWHVRTLRDVDLPTSATLTLVPVLSNPSLW